MIRRELDRWGFPEVERLLYGTGDPEVIAEVISDFCFDHFGSRPRGVLFYRSSVGSVVGLSLENGEVVVLKVFQARWQASFLESVQAVQKTLTAQGFPCPEPLLSPTPLSGGTAALVTAETLLADPGLRPLSGDQDRGASARGLATQIATCQTGQLPALALHPLASSADHLYPEPHSPLFDFEATSAGAEWIDRIAQRAKEARDSDQAGTVVAHMDWSARNVRVRARSDSRRLRLGQCRLSCRIHGYRPSSHHLVGHQRTGRLTLPRYKRGGQVHP